jgi:DNA-binding MarR family transcriptional regulator
MDDTRWLSPAERSTWVRFAAMLELLPAALDAQLQRDESLTYFDYFVLAMLSETPERVMRMSELAAITNASLPRLSHVVRRLEDQGFVRREPCAADRRATNAFLTDEGWAKIVGAAPGHVHNVRDRVIDALTPEQIDQLGEISSAVLRRLDPDGRFAATIEEAARRP